MLTEFNAMVFVFSAGNNSHQKNTCFCLCFKQQSIDQNQYGISVQKHAVTHSKID